MPSNNINNDLCLDNQMCFYLYALSRIMIKSYSELLEELNLTYPQYLVILVLLDYDDISLKSIGEKLHLDSGTLTPLLKRLEERELISRQRNPDDEREIRVKLSAKGLELKERAMPLALKVLDNNPLSQASMIQLRDSLKAALNTMTTGAGSRSNKL